MSEPAILHHSFDLLCAFDEVVSLGYKENVNLASVRNILEGESHEEKIQEIIARNKEAEAKEELKRRAKQLEMQRREQQRMAAAGGGRSGGFGGGMGGMAGGYGQTQNRYEQVQPEYRAPSPAVQPQQQSAPKPAFKGAGMKLGKKGKGNDLSSVLGGQVEDEPEPAYAAPVQQPAYEEPAVAVSADVLESVPQERCVSHDTMHEFILGPRDHLHTPHACTDVIAYTSPSKNSCPSRSSATAASTPLSSRATSTCACRKPTRPR
jgi:hypothetical protein